MISLLLFVLAVVWFCAFGASVVAVLIDETDGLYIMFNPIGMYNNSKLNIFGVSVLTVINYILFYLRLFYSGFMSCALGEGDEYDD